HRADEQDSPRTGRRIEPCAADRCGWAKRLRRADDEPPPCPPRLRAQDRRAVRPEQRGGDDEQRAAGGRRVRQLERDTEHESEPGEGRPDQKRQADERTSPSAALTAEPLALAALGRDE